MVTYMAGQVGSFERRAVGGWLRRPQAAELTRARPRDAKFPAERTGFLRAEGAARSSPVTGGASGRSSGRPLPARIPAVCGAPREGLGGGGDREGFA
jgi:hypothetical protein